MGDKSIFKTYYSEDGFADRLREKGEDGVDVIIPLINTNELWRKNLYSFYREIPMRRLLIGDGGCTDDSIDVVRQFPRVEIIDQSKHYSQGYCIAELIRRVASEWFVYLHADVYLPPGWYDIMRKHRQQYDWFECYRKLTVLMEFWQEAANTAERAFSGSQMGRTDAFRGIVDRIQDDFLQRNEDIILAELIAAQGLRYGRIADTFHYHQMMNKRGEKEPKLRSLKFERETDEAWEKRLFNMQARGIIKYLKPKPYLIENVNASIRRLDELGALDWSEFRRWVRETNRVWLKHTTKKLSWKARVARFLKG